MNSSQPYSEPYNMTLHLLPHSSDGLELEQLLLYLVRYKLDMWTSTARHNRAGCKKLVALACFTLRALWSRRAGLGWVVEYQTLYRDADKR